jgi:hypothetical protein
MAGKKTKRDSGQQLAGMTEREEMFFKANDW